MAMIDAGTDRRLDVMPYAPPRRVTEVYTDDQINRIFAAIRRLGPIQQQLGRYPQAAEGRVIEPVFRGELALETICYDASVEDVFFNSKLMRWARDYRESDYCIPRQLAFNLSVPCASYDVPHIDSPAFRGLWHVNTPPWLLNVIGFSKLFTAYQTKMVQILAWFWRGLHGGFTYWPEGVHGDPQRVPAPVWNTGLVAENQYMYHRMESALPPGEDHRIPRLTAQSTIEADSTHADGWLVRTEGESVARFRTEELRLMVHWSCEIFRDMAEVRRHFAGADPLTHRMVIDGLVEDLRALGIDYKASDDALGDPKFKALLERHYWVDPPNNYPSEAPIGFRR